MFHSSKSVLEPTSIISLEGLEVKDNISYEEIQIEILDEKVKRKLLSQKFFWRIS